MIPIDQLPQIRDAAEGKVGPTFNPVAHPRDTLRLLAEIDRLKRGDFTEEEFQNLCHNFSADDVCRFRRGCLAYQAKLFGEEKLIESITKECVEDLRIVLEEIKQS